MSATPVMRHLLLMDEGRPAGRIPVSQRPRLLGRCPDADIQLRSIAVSRRHAEVWLDGAGTILVRDLGSSNGTYVDAERVGNKPAAVRGGASIRIGTYLFTPEDRRMEMDFATESNVILGVMDMAGKSALSSAKIEAGLLMELQKFKTDLFSEPSQEQRMKAVAEFMVRSPIGAFQASVLRRGEIGFETAAGPVDARESPGVPPSAAESVLRGMLAKWGPVSAAVDSAPEAQWGKTLRGSKPGQDGRLLVCACPINETHALQAVFAPGANADERMAVLLLAASDAAHADAHWTLRELAERRAAMEMEITQARKVQKTILPKAIRLDGLDYEVCFQPCHEVAGDYVDVIVTDSGKVLFAIGDVCGKGVQAALIASFLHTYLHVDFKTSHLSLDERVGRLNAYLRETMPEGQFVTFCIVAWDPATHRIEWVNAGHPPPMVVCANRSPRLLAGNRANCPLGIEENAFSLHAGEMRDGEVLVLYTDGMTELSGKDGESLLGMRRFGDLLARACSRDLRQFNAGIQRAVLAFTGVCAQEDDQTYLLVRRRSPLDSKILPPPSQETAASSSDSTMMAADATGFMDALRLDPFDSGKDGR